MYASVVYSFGCCTDFPNILPEIVRLSWANNIYTFRCVLVIVFTLQQEAKSEEGPMAELESTQAASMLPGSALETMFSSLARCWHRLAIVLISTWCSVYQDCSIAAAGSCPAWPGLAWHQSHWSSHSHSMDRGAGEDKR